MASILNPGQTVAIGIGLGAVDMFIFSQHLPVTADVRTASPQNQDIDAARRQAVGMSVALNGFVSLVTRDWNVFLIGGVVTVAMAFLYVHANAVDPTTGKMAAQPGNQNVSPDQDNAGAYPLADYSDASQDQAA